MTISENPAGEATPQDGPSDATALELLKEATSYVESRINLVDGKAAVMMTAVAALFASLVFAAGDLPRVTSLRSASALIYVLLGVALILGACSIAFLLQTIRHGRAFFGMNVPIRGHSVQPYFMWPSDKLPSTFEDFRAQAVTITAATQFENLAATAYTTLQLVQLKYRNYRMAMLFIKLLGAWTLVSILLLGVIRATGRV